MAQSRAPPTRAGFLACGSPPGRRLPIPFVGQWRPCRPAPRSQWRNRRGLSPLSLLNRRGASGVLLPIKLLRPWDCQLLYPYTQKLSSYNCWLHRAIAFGLQVTRHSRESGNPEYPCPPTYSPSEIARHRPQHGINQPSARDNGGSPGWVSPPTPWVPAFAGKTVGAESGGGARMAKRFRPQASLRACTSRRRGGAAENCPCPAHQKLLPGDIYAYAAFPPIHKHVASPLVITPAIDRANSVTYV